MGIKFRFSTNINIRKHSFGFAILFLLLSGNSFMFGQEGWTLSTSLQYSSGNYLSNNSNKIFYLYGGAGYQTGKWSFNISVPVAAQSAGGVGQVGGMMLPNGNNGNSGGSIMGNNGRGMMGSGNSFMNNQSMSSFGHVGLGDIYLYGSYNLFEDNASLFSLTLNSFVKFPTANNSQGLGTGKFDYGASATVRQTVGNYLAFADLGYIEIGKPANINYKNPVSYGLGVGRYFDNGNYSLLLYYQAYTTIIEGYDAPKLLSLGFNYKINPGFTLSLIGGAGLSKVTSDFSFSTGLEWNL
ncbi:MAG: transporter [Bacteroidetes bacterium]|nr:transporter [Bacteroidota bacterium]